MEKIFTQYVLENCCSIFHLLRSPIIGHWKAYAFILRCWTVPSIFCSRYAQVTDITSERRLEAVIVNDEWQTADIQARIEMLLKGDPSKSYSKEEIIEELSNAYENGEIERTLREMEVSSSMTNPKSQLDSTCRNATVYFQWS